MLLSKSKYTKMHELILFRYSHNFILIYVIFMSVWLDSQLGSQRKSLKSNKHKYKIYNITTICHVVNFVFIPTQKFKIYIMTIHTQYIGSMLNNFNGCSFDTFKILEPFLQCQQTYECYLINSFHPVL